MLFLRRTPSLAQLVIRQITPQDTIELTALFQQTDWASLSMPFAELLLTLDSASSFVAEYEGRIWATVLLTWAKHPALWIRAIAVRQPLRPSKILPMLFQAMTKAAALQHAAQIFAMSDQYDLVWLRPLLIEHGFRKQVDVITYEKHDMTVPAWGNQSVTIRPVVDADIMTIALVDAHAFAPEWVKHAAILDNVRPQAPCYIVAELNGYIVGYAFATLHHQGVMAHLVRIAVLPQYHKAKIGIRLLAEVTQWCREHRVQLLSLNTQESNINAQRLYEWFGFERTSDRQLLLHLPVYD